MRVGIKNDFNAQSSERYVQLRKISTKTSRIIVEIEVFFTGLMQYRRYRITPDYMNTTYQRYKSGLICVIFKYNNMHHYQVQ